MKIAKKTLSVFLSILMVFTTCSVCLTGFSFSASAASSYTVAQVKSLVDAATAGATSSSNNSWTYQNDNGTVLAAAEAVFDYAVNGVRVSGASSNPNATSTLATKVISNLGYSASSNQGRFITNVLNPNGSTIYSQQSPSVKTGMYNDTTQSPSVSGNANITYNDIGGNITKTATVKVNRNSYLLTFSSIDDIPSTFPLEVRYSYAHKTSSSARFTNHVQNGDTGGCNASPKYDHFWESKIWHYLDATPSRSVVSTDTTTKNDLVTYKNYFSADRLSTVAADLLNESAASLTTLHQTATSNYNALLTKYGSAVVDRFFGIAAIEAYLGEVEFAKQVVLAQPNMATMLALMEAGYDNTNREQMGQVYTSAKAAYDVISGYDQAIFDYIIANYDGFDSFTLAAATAFINQLYLDIELYDLRVLKADIDASIAEKEPLVADPENREDITDLELAAMQDMFNGYMNSYNTFSAAAKAAVFTDGVEYVTAFQDKISLKINTRDAQVDYDAYYAYFLPKIYAPIEQWDNAYIMTRYNEDVPKNTQLKNSYNGHKATIGEAIATSVFTFVYEEQNVFLVAAADDYIARLKANITQRNNAQLDLIAHYADMAPQINFSNFIGVKTAIDVFDADLYNFANGKGWVDTAHRNIYNRITPLLNDYAAFVASGGLDRFVQNHYHNSSSIYTVRYAGDQTNAANEQIGYPNDLARDGAPDNYTVDINKVNQTIAKLDTFLTSEEFCDLVGLKDKETGIAYNNLSQAIESTLSDNLFTNEMVNTLVAAIFPMLIDTVGGLIGDLGSLGIDGISQSADPNAAARIDLGVLSGSSVTGYIDLFLDGNENTNSLVEVFESLGVYIYPESFAKVLPARYAQQKADFAAAGRDWTRFADAEGKIKFEYDWGVTDYNSFVTAVGDVFGSILPLLQTVLAKAEFSRALPDRAVYATSPSITIKDVIGSLDVTGKKVRASATASVKIPGLDVYKTVWIPLMENLGIADNGYRFNTITNSATGPQLAVAMFNPVLELINQLKVAPLDKVLSMLPQLMYLLSMDGIQDLIDSVNIPLHVELEITRFDRIEIGVNLSGIANLFLGSINGALPQIDTTIKLADMVNLQEMLGFEYTNINSLLRFVLQKLNLDLALPIMNAGEIIQCSSFNRNAPSQSTAGTRLKFTSDKADVFYFLMKYLINAVGDRSFVEGLIRFIQNSSAGEGEEGGEAGEPVIVELPELVYTIINKVNSDPTTALAALVEIFVPQRYSEMEYSWVESKYDYADIPGTTAASVVYLHYGNDWTRAKAEYVIDNIDELLEEVLTLLGSEEPSVNALMQKAVSGLFNNKNFTGLIKGLATLGLTLKSETLYNLFEVQAGVDLTLWYDAFGYLFPELDEKYGTTALQPTDAGYVNNFGVTAVDAGLAEDGTQLYTWYINGTEFVDGDRNIFLDLFTATCDEFAPLISLMLSGEDFEMFAGALTILGYENYANSIGMMFQMFGIENVMTQAEYNAMEPAAAFNKLTKQLFDWFDYMLEGNTIEKICQLLPRFIYFIESNGLSTVIHNLLMPVLVLVDTVRPIVDVDINNIASTIVSDLLNNGTIDTSILLDLIAGTYVAPENPDYKRIEIDLNNITLTKIVELLDTVFETDFSNSGLIDPGLTGLCSGKVAIENSVIGEAYTSKMDAADALTIFVSALIDSIDKPSQIDGKSNIDVIVDLIEERTGRDNIKPIVDTVLDIFDGVEFTYTEPNWGYMFNIASDFSVTLPEKSIVYLGYTTDWTEETADGVYAALDEIVDMLLASKLAEGETIATLLDAVLNDKVYTNAILNKVIETLVNLIANFEGVLLNLVDAILSTNIAQWFTYCTFNAETGKYECTYDWGIDTATDKKAAFVSAIKTVLEPANALLEWLFFGGSYEFLTGTEKDAGGHYTYNDLITFRGGEGYNFGIVPILEALGVEAKTADTYYDAATGTYNVGNAVEDVFNGILGIVDRVSANPVEEVFKLLPNILYFINADGIKSSVNNLIAPINAFVETLSPIIAAEGETVNIGSLLEAQIGLNISDLTMDTILGIAADKGLVLNPEMYEILTTFYIGELSAFTSANGNTSYKMVYTDEQSAADMLTIVISFVIDTFKLNGAIFSDLLGADTYNAIMALLSNAAAFDYVDLNWAYMYDGEDALAQLIANNLPARTEDSQNVYTKYTNNWDTQTADFLSGNLNELINAVLDLAGKSDTSIGKILDDAVAGGLYQDKVLKGLLETVVKLLADLDKSLIDAVGAALSVDFDAWFDWCEIERDADNKVVSVTCTKDWGIDSKATNAEKKDAFVAAFTEALAPANRVLAWLFFGESYTFFNGTTSEVLITLSGGEGYAYALVPLLEALGASPKAPSEFYVAGELDTSAAVSHVFEQLTNVIADICDELGGRSTVDKIIDLLPNIIYFVNADGLKAVVNNLLAPVTSLLETLEPVVGSVDLDTLVGLPITSLDFNAIFTILADKLGITVSAPVAEFITNFYIGKVEKFTSANGRDAFRMVYSDAETRRDMLTIVLSVALEIVTDDANDAKFSELFGAETFAAIKALLAGAQTEFTYGDPNWAYMYDGDDALAQLIANNLPARTEASQNVYTQYTNNWDTRTADFLNGNLNELINAVMDLAGQSGTSIGKILDDAIAGGLYQDKILKGLLETVVKLLADLDETLVEAIGVTLDVDFDTWFDWCTIERGEDGKVTKVTCTKDWGIDSKATNAEKKDAFVAAFTEALAPANRVLAWLFFAEDYTFLNYSNGDDIITLTGGEGYAYALVPLLEALGASPKAPAEFYVAGELDMSAAVAHVFEQLTNIMADICDELGERSTVDKIIDLLPNIIYFVNADGLKAVVNNLLKPIDHLLTTLAPLVGEVDLDELLGLPITNLDFNAVFAILADKLGIIVPAQVATFITEFYIGEVAQFTSANGRDAFRMVYSDAESRRDMLTIVLSVALEIVTDDANDAKFAELFGADKFAAIKDLLKGAQTEFTYGDPNWAYMYDGDDALAQLLANNLPARTGENSFVYTQYTNNWNEATANYLNNNLNTIVNEVVKAIREDDSSIGNMIDDAITKGLYTNSILNKLLETVVKLLAGLDRTLVDAIGVTLDVDFDTWFDWCIIERDAEGKVTKVTCTKDWGIDSKTTNAEKKDAFVAAFVEALEPANRVLAWLFFAQDYTFLNDSNGEDVITLTGGEGYTYALVPLLEALGATPKAASEFYTAGELDMNAAVAHVFETLTDVLYAICGDLQDIEDGEGALDVILDLIPNIVYFVNAGGLKAVVNNLLKPVDHLLTTLAPLTGEINLDEMIGFPLTNIDFYAIFGILGDKLGLYFPPMVADFIANFYIGKVEKFTSVNGRDAFRMVYSENEDRRDMITILLSIVLDVFEYDMNADRFIRWFGADVYNSLKAVLGIKEAKPMQNYSWYYTEYANTDKSFTAIETSGVYVSTYNEYWTREKAQYVAENIEVFVGNILCLLGLEIGGIKLDNIDTVVKNLLDTNVFTQANADAILNLLKDLVSKVSALEPYGEYITTVLKSSLGVDLTAWDTMTVTVVDGDSESFKNALTQMLAPVTPLLGTILAGEDISFFIDLEGNEDQIVIPGSEGYAYGIIPLLEALGCKNILTPAEYKAAGAADNSKYIGAILDSLFARIDEIVADPLNEVLDMLPAVVYFINSNGLDTTVKNVLNSIDTVLAALEPILGHADIVSLLGIDLSVYDFEYLVRMALEAVKDSTGYDLTAMAGDAIAELTVGKVVTYESKNGETYYTMVYGKDRDRADMVTIVLRILVDFATDPENIQKIEALLEDKIPNEDNYKSICSVLESLANYASKDPGMGQALYLLYYIFFGVNEAGEVVDDLYHDTNNSWKFILKLLDDSSDPMLNDFSKNLKNTLNKYFDGIFTEDGVAPNGFITFFQKIAEFFRKIAEFFRNLFNRG